MNHRLISAAVAAVIVVGSLAGCGKHQGQASVATAPPPVEAPPAPPPPTMAAQHEIALTGMGARMADDGLYVTIPGDQFGGKKHDEFMPPNTDMLDRVAGLLRERSELRAIIVGYADDKADKKTRKGKPPADDALGKRMAEAVRDDLVSRNHVDTGRLEVQAGSDAEGASMKEPRVVVRIVNPQGKYESRAAMGVQPANAQGVGGTPVPAGGSGSGSGG